MQLPRASWLQNWEEAAVQALLTTMGASWSNAGCSAALISSSHTLKAPGVERRGGRRELKDASGGDAVVGAVIQSSSLHVVGFGTFVLLSKPGA